MPITFGRAAQAKQGAAGTATPIVVTITINAGETGVLMVAHSAAAPGSVTTITGGGLWTRRLTLANGIAKLEIWSTDASAAAAAASLSIAWSGTDDGIQAEAAAYLGVLGIGIVASGTGTSSNPSIVLGTQDANNFVVGGYAWADGTAALPVPTALTGNFRTGDSNSVSGANDSAAALTDNTSASAGNVTNATTELASAGTKWVAGALELRSVATNNPPPLLGNLFVGKQRYG